MHKEFLHKKGVYKISTSNDILKFYISSSLNIGKRIRIHFRALELNKHHSPKLQYYYNKYGKDSFSVEILEEFTDITKEDLFKEEQFYLDMFRPYFNVARLAKSIFKGKKMSDEEKSYLCKSILEFDINKVLTNTWRSVAEVAKIYKCSQSIVSKCARGETPRHIWKGKFFIYKENYTKEEFNKRIDECLKFKLIRPKTREITKPVIVITPEGTILEFSQPRKAREYLKISKATISRCLSGKKKEYKGHIIYLKSKEPEFKSNIL